MAGAPDFVENLPPACRIENISAHADRDQGVPAAVDNEQRRFHVFDLFVIFKGVFGQRGGKPQTHYGRHVASIGHGRNQNQSRDVLVLGQVCCGGRTDGTPEYENPGRRNTQLPGQIIEGGFSIAVNSGFAGTAFAFLACPP